MNCAQGVIPFALRLPAPFLLRRERPQRRERLRLASAVSEMPIHEQHQAEDNPRKLRAQKMTGSIRWLELYRAYLLADELGDAPRQDHKAIIDDWALSMGMTPATLGKHLGWARAIDLQMLADSFEGFGISEQEWTARIGTTHLQEIAKAKNQTTNLVATPGQMVDLVIECYHGNWSVAELKKALRERNLRAPEKGMKIEPTKNLTACQLLAALARDLPKRGVDINLGILPVAWGKPRKVAAILRGLASKFAELYKDTEFAPKVESNPKETTDRKETN